MNVACILLCVWERLSMYLEEEERKKLGPTSYAYASSADDMGFKFSSLSRAGILFKSLAKSLFK